MKQKKQTTILNLFIFIFYSILYTISSASELVYDENKESIELGKAYANCKK